MFCAYVYQPIFTLVKDNFFFACVYSTLGGVRGWGEEPLDNFPTPISPILPPKDCSSGRLTLHMVEKFLDLLHLPILVWIISCSDFVSRPTSSNSGKLGCEDLSSSVNFKIRVTDITSFFSIFIFCCLDLLHRSGSKYRRQGLSVHELANQRKRENKSMRKIDLTNCLDERKLMWEWEMDYNLKFKSIITKWSQPT